MQKREFIGRVAAKTGVTKRDSDQIMDAVCQTLAEGLEEGDRFNVAGVGVFYTNRRAARTARNPHTGGRVSVPALTVPVFRPARGLRDYLNDSAKEET